MSNFTQLISRPIISDCPFNAVGNPIVYTLRREDYNFQQINNVSGLAQIQINAVDVTSYFQVDDLIYVEGLGVGTITASAFSTNTLLTTNIAFTSSDDGYVNNLSKRTDYSIEVEVFNVVTGASMGPRLVAGPSQDGTAKFDISGIIKSFLSVSWEQPSGVEIDATSYRDVYIKWQEFYNDTYWELISDSDNDIVGVFAIMHLLQGSDYKRYLYGGNMIVYFPEDSQRKFLTRFNPSYWRGWPFSLSWLGRHVVSPFIRVTQYDSEGTELSTTDTSYTGIQRVVFRSDLGTINAAATKLIVALGTDGEVGVTEDLTINVKDPCDNPVLLFWKNAAGGDAFWMFDESQDYEYSYPSGRKVKRLKLYADNLTIDEWEGINQLNSATEVIAYNIVDYNMDDSIDRTHFRNDNQAFIINQDGSKTGIIVIPKTSETKSSFRKSAIELEIELPEYFTV
jgi:hypothetical protein